MLNVYIQGWAIYRSRILPYFWFIYNIHAKKTMMTFGPDIHSFRLSWDWITIQNLEPVYHTQSRGNILEFTFEIYRSENYFYSGHSYIWNQFITRKVLIYFPIKTEILKYICLQIPDFNYNAGIIMSLIASLINHIFLRGLLKCDSSVLHGWSILCILHVCY